MLQLLPAAPALPQAGSAEVVLLRAGSELQPARSLISGGRDTACRLAVPSDAARGLFPVFSLGNDPRSLRRCIVDTIEPFDHTCLQRAIRGRRSLAGARRFPNSIGLSD